MEALQTKLQQQLNQLPWQNQTVSLLMDGINVQNLLHRFYIKGNTSPFEVLYLQTPFAQLYEVSPCLIKLDNINNRHLQDHLQNLENEWGYLLVSDQDWQQQINHLRNLITVQLPETNEQIILKLADPQVSKALFSLAETQEDTEFFGPFSHIYTADIIDNQINHYQRPDKTILPLHSPYTLSKEQDQALDTVEIKRSNYKLYQHMLTYFPEYLAHYPKQTQKEAIYHLIQEAKTIGYQSEMEQAYYLNIHGYLGERELKDFPELTNLVNQAKLEPLRTAAELAKKLVANQ